MDQTQGSDAQPINLPAIAEARNLASADDAVFHDVSRKSNFAKSFLTAAGDFGCGLAHNAIKKPFTVFLGLPFSVASAGFFCWVFKEYALDNYMRLDGRIVLGMAVVGALGAAYFALGAQHSTGKFIREHRVLGSDGKWKLPEHSFKSSGGREGMVEISDNTWGEAHEFSGRELAENLKYRLLPLLKKDLKPYRQFGADIYSQAKEQAFDIYRVIVDDHYGEYLKPDTIDRVFNFLDRELQPPKNFTTAISFPKNDRE